MLFLIKLAEYYTPALCKKCCSEMLAVSLTSVVINKTISIYFHESDCI